MVSTVQEKLKGFVGHRWVVFVCAMWDLSFAGTAYMFGSISPVIKSTMGFNQQQVVLLSVAKDLGDCVGLLSGKLSEVWPTWRVMLVGVIQNLVGYGLVWLVVTHSLPSLPLWTLCISIFVGQNGATYYNTVALVSSVQSFPESRGPVVGILKGFIGLSGAIWTQIIAMINFPDQASIIFIIAVGPAMVSFTLMFIIRPVQSHKYSRASDESGFMFIYSVCLLLAAYLLGVLLVENMFDLEQSTITLFAVILIILLLLPIIVPIILVFFSKPKSPDEETLLEPPMPTTKSMHDDDCDETSVSPEHVEDENPPQPEVLPLSQGPRDKFQFQSKLFQVVEKIKQENGPHIGEDFTLTQALVNVDFWIMFLSLVLSSGSGMAVINNMGQICQSLGDDNVNFYVSVISISNFLGRVGGGYFSEVIIRKFAYPRLVALAVIQLVMSLGLMYYALGLVGQVYVLAISMGSGFGAQWSVGIAATSELFGLKNFGTMYNFLTMANPTGSLILSGFVASTIYDYYAEQQTKHDSTGGTNEFLLCEGNICYSLTCGILSVACLFATALSLIIVHRSKRFYAQFYGKSQNLS
ncbi:Nodulin-like [Sesbania bispinosa]|nr:Nodulin-like [Sesbania bispinosa]